MRAKSKLLALALGAALQPAFADVVTLNFEDPALWLADPATSVNGVDFSGNAFVTGSSRGTCLQKPDPDFPGFNLNLNWTGPSCGALILAKNPWDTSSGTGSFTIHFAAGFDQLVFDFSSLDRSVQIEAFVTETDATGVGSAGILAPANDSCGVLRFCDWTTDRTLALSKTAYYLKVTGSDQSLLLDNLRFTAAAASAPLPEPGSVGLALSAIGALAWVRRRSAR